MVSSPEADVVQLHYHRRWVSSPSLAWPMLNININNVMGIDIGMSRIKDDERHTLASAHGTFNFRQHRKTRARWNQEWGSMHKEGNPWQLGSGTRNVRMVFGKRKLAWFCE